MGVLWETGFGVYLLVSVFLGGGAAWLTGRAVAQTWRPLLQLVLYLVFLCCAVRFIHFSLFGGTLTSPYYFVTDFITLAVLGGLGFRLTRTGQMVSQYAWLYRRTTPLSWRPQA
jgi:hypothetical protein